MLSVLGIGMITHTKALNNWHDWWLMMCMSISSQVKAEVDHMKVHKGWKVCERCVNTRDLVKQHAAVCRRTGCRVPDCERLR